jgi:hypothetical protein
METRSLVIGETGTRSISVDSNVETFHGPDQPESVVEPVFAEFSQPGRIFPSDEQITDGSR